MQPLVTIIMCVYNAGTYLRPALESVLGQTHQNLEILVIDDGSTDGCMSSITDLADARIRVFRQTNQGKPAALNVALQQLQGEFYAIADADDLSYPSRIERQLEVMRRHPDVAAVYSGYDLLVEGRRVAPLAEEKDQARCRHDIDHFVMPSHDPTGLYRVSAVQGIAYDPSLPVGQGYDYILRVGEQHAMWVVGECLYGYRIHGQSITKRNPEQRNRLVLEVIRRACERRGLRFEQLFPATANGPTPRTQRNADNNLAAHFMDSVCWQRRRGSVAAAVTTGLQCVGLYPTDPHYWKALVYALLPQATVRRIRRAR